MDRGNLKQLGDVLDSGTAGLIVVYQANLADQVAANIKAMNRIESPIIDLTADEIAEEIRAASTALHNQRCPHQAQAPLPGNSGVTEH